jgi:hypothetical protein
MEFSHSETPGSKLASSSPGLIAGNHVLHRLIVPRHPSYALKYLTILCSLRPTLRPSKFCYTIVSTLNSFPHIDTMALKFSHRLNRILSYRCALFFLNLLQNCCIKVFLLEYLIYPYSLSNSSAQSLLRLWRSPSLKILVTNQSNDSLESCLSPLYFNLISDLYLKSVEHNGIEPLTSRMQIWRSPS